MLRLLFFLCTTRAAFHEKYEEDHGEEDAFIIQTRYHKEFEEKKEIVKRIGIRRRGNMASWVGRPPFRVSARQMVPTILTRILMGALALFPKLYSSLTVKQKRQEDVVLNEKVAEHKGLCYGNETSSIFLP